MYVFILSCQFFFILRGNISTDTLIAYCNISAEHFTVFHSLLHQVWNIMYPCCLNIHYIYMHSVHCTMLLYNDGVMLWLTRLNVFPACTIYMYILHIQCTTH